MAITVLLDAKVTYNSVDLSDHVESVEVTQTYDEVDITAMGADARAFTPGLRDDTITVNFFQDHASAKVDATIYPLLGSAAGAVLVVVPVNTTVSTTNPSYTVTASPYTYSPLNGTIGAASMTSVTFMPVAGSSIVRATS